MFVCTCMNPWRGGVCVCMDEPLDASVVCFPPLFIIPWKHPMPGDNL